MCRSPEPAVRGGAAHLWNTAGARGATIIQLARRDLHGEIPRASHTAARPKAQGRRPAKVRRKCSGGWRPALVSNRRGDTGSTCIDVRQGQAREDAYHRCGHRAGGDPVVTAKRPHAHSRHGCTTVGPGASSRGRRRPVSGDND